MVKRQIKKNLFLILLQYPCRIASHDTIRRNIFRHYGIGCNQSPISYRNTRENRRLVTYPHIVAHDNWPFRGNGTLAWRQAQTIKISLPMRIVGNGHPLTRQAVITDNDSVGTSNMIVSPKATMTSYLQERLI